ncbi:MAG: SPOR domain-containing protein [Gammaproteobacteria bacterium]|nr:SPOR domain-containing protein [Gammaproteobacteria bacterium]
MRHRIIGSLVWLSVAVIVLPFVLDGDGLKDLTQAAAPVKMPVPLDIQPIEIEPVDPAQPIALAPVAKVAEPQKAQQASNTAPQKPTLDTQGLPSSWVVQLASFKSKGNADALRKKLIKDKYAAYMQQHNSNYRVLVGPVNTRTEADKLKSKLKQGYKLSGIVVAYTINN